MHRLLANPSRRLAVLLPALAWSLPVQAHVKWFADWSVVMCPPRDPARVLGLPLWQGLFAAAIAAMAALAALDRNLSARPNRRLQRMHDRVMPHAFDALRAGLCLYWLLVALTLATPVYLTPELAAPEGVRWLQIACALAVLRRTTCWLAGIGLLSLYAMAVWQHGWFHLLDYPLFLALGVILVLPAVRGRDDDVLALELLRWSAAVTLLWGGIEKFAFPQWSFDMLSQRPLLSLGVPAETAMYLYGFGELAMAFGLLFFGVGSQVAAALLLAVFLVAVPPFGWVDLVGHSGIVVALVLLSLIRPRRTLSGATPRRNAALHGAAFPATVMLLWSAYFGLHGVYLASMQADPGAEIAARSRRAAERALQAAAAPAATTLPRELRASADASLTMPLPMP